MAEYTGMVLTRAGLNLQAKAQTGAQLVITRVALGEGILSEDQSYEDMTELIDEKVSLGVQSLEITGDGQSRIRVLITNDKLTTGFFIREVAVFAKAGQDGQEVLYSYTNANDRADFLPARGVNMMEEILDIFIVVGNAQSVTAIMDDRVIIATKDDVEKAITEHSEDIETAHAGLLMRGGFKNYIINGNFDVWQRGTSQVNVGGYASVDRWFFNPFNVTNYSLTRMECDGSEPFNAQFYTRLNCTLQPNTTTYTFLYQSIENITGMSGKKITFSFWVRGNTAKEKIQYSARVVTTASKKFDKRINKGIAAGWNKIEETFDLKDVKFSKDDVMKVYIGVTGDIDPEVANNGIRSLDIAQIQLEAGEVATEFEYRPPGLELALCQRYYEKATCSFTSYCPIIEASAYKWAVCARYLTYSEKRSNPTIRFLNSETKSNRFGVALFPAGSHVYFGTLGVINVAQNGCSVVWRCEDSNYNYTNAATKFLGGNYADIEINAEIY